MKLRPVDLLALLARLAVGGVLIFAGFMKATGPSAEFAALLETYKLFPSVLLTPLATGLPYIEMWAGLFVLTGFYTRQASLVTALLSLSFFTAVGSTFLRHIDLTSCGCFGAESLTPKHTMMLDIVLLTLSLFIHRTTKIPPPVSLDTIVP